jgi:hypothetical protein
MLRLAEAGDVATLAYPLWLGVLFLLGAVALAAHLVLRKEPRRGTVGVAIAAIICLFGAWHFIASRTTLAPDGARVYQPMREDSYMAWREVTHAQVETRQGGRGGPANYLVLRSGDGAELAIALTPLPLEARARVMELVNARVQASR